VVADWVEDRKYHDAASLDGCPGRSDRREQTRSVRAVSSRILPATLSHCRLHVFRGPDQATGTHMQRAARRNTVGFKVARSKLADIGVGALREPGGRPRRSQFHFSGRPEAPAAALVAPASRPAALRRRHLGTRMRDAGQEVSLCQGALPQASSAALASCSWVSTPRQPSALSQLRIRVGKSRLNEDDVGNTAVSLEQKVYRTADGPGTGRVGDRDQKAE
jgi:hypothetical protein